VTSAKILEQAHKLGVVPKDQDTLTRGELERTVAALGQAVVRRNGLALAQIDMPGDNASPATNAPAKTPVYGPSLDDNPSAAPSASSKEVASLATAAASATAGLTTPVRTETPAAGIAAPTAADQTVKLAQVTGGQTVTQPGAATTLRVSSTTAQGTGLM